jgi:glycosyltransferase involved in cell wall biosynthesis
MQAKGPPLVSVVVPARDAESTLSRTLDALADQDLDGPYEVIVVDDGSSDATSRIAADARGDVRVIRHEHSRGAGAARNTGAGAATAPTLAFTDSDCYPASNWLSAGLRWIEAFDLVQGAVEPDREAERGPWDRTLTVRRAEGYYQTANLLVRRELFESLGGFEDWIDSSREPMGEDVLFGWRAARAGAKVAFAPDAVIQHAVFPSTMAGALRYRWRWGRRMPALLIRVPELRETLFYRRWFLARRSAEFDFALSGLILAAITRRWVFALATGPYARRVRREARDWGPDQMLAVAIGTVAGEAVTLVALLLGGLHWRRPLL